MSKPKLQPVFDPVLGQLTPLDDPSLSDILAGQLLIDGQNVELWVDPDSEPLETCLQLAREFHAMAEELVSNYYKMSASEWLRPKYDVKTLVDLAPGEIVDGPFAQIVRYEGHRKNTPLGSGVFDYYKICLQDHTIRSTLEPTYEFPF